MQKPELVRKEAGERRETLDYRVISGLEEYIHSTLFNEVFLFRDLPFRYPNVWDKEFEGTFDTFFTQLHNLAKGATLDKIGRSHAETLENWIHPILESLGWYLPPTERRPNVIENTLFNVNDHLGNEVVIRPSILIFPDGDSQKIVRDNRKTDRALMELRNYKPVPVATGYFNSFADRRSGRYDPAADQVGERGDAFTALGLDHQASKYLDILGQNWGMATDGACWRLYSQGAVSHGSLRFYEFDLKRLYNELKASSSEEHLRLREIAKYFYWFFSNEALTTKPVSFVNRVKEDSKVYTDRIGEDLKERFVHAMTIACNAFSRSASIRRGDPRALELIRGVSESFIFNLLFIRSCESSRVLPLHQDYIPVSLHNLVNKIRDYTPQKSWQENVENLEPRLSSISKGNFQDDRFDLYDYVANLYDLVHKGNGSSKNFGFVIHGFKEGLFSPEELKFYEKEKIDNKAMVQLLFELFYDAGDSNGASYRQVAFSSFSPRQLGSIYESFLGFKLETANEALYYVRKKKGEKIYWQWLPKKDLSKSFGERGVYAVAKGDLIFSPDNTDRKASGSYYTPDYIVDYILSHGLAPVFEGKRGEDVLKVKICDPAMGSGHFLLGALDFVTEHYVRTLPAKERKDPRLAKREILKHCLFGVDLNKSAVKLAKLSLWLATANAGDELEHLDDQLADGDSLVRSFKWKDVFREAFEEGGFHAVIGNPPWGAATFNANELEEKIRNSVDLKNLNSFDLFLRVAQNLIRAGGRIGFVLPRNFLRNDSYKNLRKAVLSYLECIADIGKFPGVIQEACVVILGNRTLDSDIRMDRSLRDPGAEVIKLPREKVLGPDYRFRFQQSTELDGALATMKKFPRLSSYFKPTRGIECGKRGEYILCKCGRYSTPPKKKNKQGKNEKDCADCGRKLTLNDEIVHLIVPRTSAKGYKGIVVGPDVTKEGVNVSKSIKLNIDGINYKDEAFKSKLRIYVPKNNDKVVAALDSSGEFLATQTVYVLNPVGSGEHADGIVTVLNSAAIRFFFEYEFNCGGKLTNAIKSEDLSALPIPVLDKVTKKSSEEEILAAYGVTKRQITEILSFLENEVGRNDSGEEEDADRDDEEDEAA